MSGVQQSVVRSGCGEALTVRAERVRGRVRFWRAYLTKNAGMKISALCCMLAFP